MSCLFEIVFNSIVSAFLKKDLTFCRIGLYISSRVSCFLIRENLVEKGNEQLSAGADLHELK